MRYYQHYINSEYLNTKFIILNVFTAYIMVSGEFWLYGKDFAANYIPLHVRKIYIGAIAKTMVQ